MPREDSETSALDALEARIAALERALRDKEHVEAQLKESQDRLALILEGAHDGWWDWDLQTDEIYFSPRWWEIIGYQPDELPATAETWRELTHPDDVERVSQAYAAALRGASGRFEVESRRRHKDGHWVPVLTRGKVVADASGKPERIAGTTTDLTERKAVDNALCASEARFRSMVETTVVGVWALDATHRTTFVNQRVAEMLGYERADMLGRPVEDFLFDEDWEEHRAAMARRRAGRRDTYERRMRRRDGSSVWVIVCATPTRSADGDFVGSFATMTDITERKEAEVTRAGQLEELRRWYVATLGREERIAELKREVNALSLRLGVLRPYAEPFVEESPGGL